jgi:hypothetical protein
MLARIVLSAIGATLPRASDPAPSCVPLKFVRPDPLPVVVSKAPDDGIETLQGLRHDRAAERPRVGDRAALSERQDRQHHAEKCRERRSQDHHAGHPMFAATAAIAAASAAAASASLSPA